MTDTRCGYEGDRDEALIAYLYDDDDIAPIDRSSFEAHVAACGQCRAELDELRGVRAHLSRWTPPLPERRPSTVDPRPSTAKSRLAHSWREIPAWAQVAAAMLVLGISAGVANLNVHYDRDGLTVRTGWSKPAVASNDPSVGRDFSRAESAGEAQLKLRPTNAGPANDHAPWRDDLAALERQLRRELRSSAVSMPTAATRAASTSAMSNDEMIRRVRELIAASERRQQSELALRVASVARDVNAARAGDLARIEQTLGMLQTSTGAELMKQRQQMVNYLTQVSLRR